MDQLLIEIWKRFDFPLRRFVRHRVDDRDIAEDLLQDIYLKIHTNIRTLRNPERLESWVYRIARNAVIDHYRTRRAASELPDSVSEERDDHERGEFERGLAQSVRHMMVELPPIYREALILADIEGVSQVQLAGRLGLSFSGAKSRVQRARLLLKKMLFDCCTWQFDRLGRVIDYEPRAENRCSPRCDAVPHASSLRLVR